jgi:hypothetical protein
VFSAGRRQCRHSSKAIELPPARSPSFLSPLPHIFLIHALLLHRTKPSTQSPQPHQLPHINKHTYQHSHIPALTPQLSHTTSTSNSPIQQQSTHTSHPLSPQLMAPIQRVARWYAFSKLAFSRSTPRRLSVYGYPAECWDWLMYCQDWDGDESQ